MSAPRHGAEISILQIGWRHKVLLVVGCFCGAGGGLALASYVPAVFESNAQVLIVKKRPDAVTGLDTRQFSAEGYLAPAPELLRSSLILDKAVRTTAVSQLPMFADEQERVEVVRKGLAVTPVKSSTGPSNIFKLAFRSRNANDSVVVLTAVIDSFKDFIDKKHQSVSTDTIDLLLREKASVQRELADKEAAYRRFLETCPLLSKGKDGLDLRQENLNSIQAQRSALLMRRVDIEGQLGAIETALREGRNRESILALLVEFSSRSVAGEAGRDKHVVLQEQLFPLIHEELKLLDTYGPKHPEVVAVRGRIEAARRALLLPPITWMGTNEKGGKADSKTGTASLASADPIDAHLQVLKLKREQIRASEAQLAKAYQAEQDEVRRLASFEIQDETFRTNIALSKQMYETLVRRLGDVSLLRNVGGYEVEAMELPSLGVKVAPNQRLFTLVGGLVGALAALALALLATARRHEADRNNQVVGRVFSATALLDDANGNGNHRDAAHQRATAEVPTAQSRLN